MVAQTWKKQGLSEQILSGSLSGKKQGVSAGVSRVSRQEEAGSYSRKKQGLSEQGFSRATL